MSLTPLPHAPGVVRPTEVIPVVRFVQPSALAGRFAGLPTSRLATVMLVMLVAVIEEEEIAATAALTSLGLRGHRGQNDHDLEGKKSRSPEGEEEPGTKKEEEISAEVPEENPPKKIQFQTGAVTAFSFRR